MRRNGTGLTVIQATILQSSAAAASLSLMGHSANKKTPSSKSTIQDVMAPAHDAVAWFLAEEYKASRLKSMADIESCGEVSSVSTFIGQVSRFLKRLNSQQNPLGTPRAPQRNFAD